MNIIHAKALGFGAAALLASGIVGGASARAQGVVQPNSTAARLNAVSNLIQGQTTRPTTVAQPVPYQQPGMTYYSPTTGQWTTQQPTYAPNGYVQQPYRQPAANGYVPTQYVQPAANGYAQPIQPGYTTPYQQPTYSGYGYTQPQQAYTPFQQPYPQTTTQRYADAVRSVVQPQQYQYAAPGYQPQQAAPRYVFPR
ncbi:hypothetical protein [Paludisphaera soli]|uniref:hypothetical protein n=1 Tax=Paludisphaera soli TaxID=2712865 RepID=UPI0013E9F7E0|nr:hypothetical protein [Paludisphaera soli]